MAGVKGHPVFSDILFKIADYYATHTNEQRNNVSVVQTTGPGYVTVMSHKDVWQ